MINKEKTCSKCDKIYPATLEYFHKCSSKKSGLNYACKKCINECRRKYHQKHREELLLYKKYYKDHKEEVNRSQKKYWQEHKEEKSNHNKKYYRKHKEKINNYNKKYYQEHKEEASNYKKKYRQEHKEEMNEWAKNRKKNNIEFRISQNLRSKLHKILNSQNAKKSAHTIELVGCTIKELLRHIKSQFDSKMTWDNYGYYGWHIDHIKPCAAFDLTKTEEQKKCFNYKNLQPLWWPDNLSKTSFYKGKLYRKNK